MVLLSAILLFALTRQEIIERFRAEPVTKVSGLVQVVADCPADMRREFQTPVAGNVAEICRTLYRGETMQPLRFDLPAIIVHIGDVRTNIANVVARPSKRDDGSSVTRIYIPSPGFADLGVLRTEVVKAFYRAVKGEELDDAAAVAKLRAADPVLRANDDYEAIERWLAGKGVAEDDEHYMKLCRSVITPGLARESDVLRFASRLRLYPPSYDAPFCGKYASCAFAEAVDFAKEDRRIRVVAFDKAPLVIAYGGGRGEELLAAAEAYSRFLFDLAAYVKPREELLAELEEADAKLNVALEAARMQVPQM